MLLQCFQLSLSTSQYNKNRDCMVICYPATSTMVHHKLIQHYNLEYLHRGSEIEVSTKLAIFCDTAFLSYDDVNTTHSLSL